MNVAALTFAMFPPSYLLEAAVRRERLVEMKRAFLRHPLPTPDGVDLADDIASERQGHAH